MDRQAVRRAVVVGVDGSERALRAVRWGAAEAVQRQIPLRLMIAFGWRHDAGHPGLGQRYRDRLLEIAREQLADAAAVGGRGARRRAGPVRCGLHAGGGGGRRLGNQ